MGLFLRRERLTSTLVLFLSVVIVVQLWVYLSSSATDETELKQLGQQPYIPHADTQQHTNTQTHMQPADTHSSDILHIDTGVVTPQTNVTSHAIVPTSDAVFAKRLARVEEVCKQGGVRGGVRNVIKIDKAKSKAIYCFVAKAGCTFWKSVSIRMREKEGLRKDNLFTIPNIQVHKRAQMTGFSASRDNTSNYPLRFLVTRDPVSRLVSAWLDKVYLPDFWQSEVNPMLTKAGLRGGSPRAASSGQDFLRDDLDKIHRVFGNESAFTKGLLRTQDDRKCGKYATFTEFIQAAIDRQEPHWMPVTSLCDPCQFKVTHVSHMETFTPDAVAILDKMGVHDVIDDLDKDSQVADQFRQLVDTNYFMTFGDPPRRAFFSKCLSTRELAYRLWNHFRWRGYIHPEVDYVIPELTDAERVKADLMTQLHQSHDRAKTDRQATKDFKKKFSENVFKNLPENLFQRFLAKYKFDFNLFEYEHIREKHIANRKQTSD